MDAEREREIRELAARLIGSKRHRKIGVVLGDLLGEIDLLREGDVPSMSYDEAMALIRNYTERGLVGQSERRSGASAWREAVLAKVTEYPSS